VRRDGKVVMCGDGQSTQGSEVLKASAKKLRRLYNGRSLPDSRAPPPTPSPSSRALKPSSNSTYGNLARSVVELAKDWRTDRMLRHLEALLLVADIGATYIVSGTGDVIGPRRFHCRHRLRRPLREILRRRALREHQAHRTGDC